MTIPEFFEAFKLPNNQSKYVKKKIYQYIDLKIFIFFLYEILKILF
jgi:hypothetical protein